MLPADDECKVYIVETPGYTAHFDYGREAKEYAMRHHSQVQVLLSHPIRWRKK